MRRRAAAPARPGGSRAPGRRTPAGHPPRPGHRPKRPIRARSRPPERTPRRRSRSWRTGGGGRWRTWTTTANAPSGPWTRNATPNAPVPPRSGCLLDNLERALEHADTEPGAVIQGVRAVLDQARDVIARLGYPRQDDVGVPFDPFRHEAVSTLADTDAPEGTVVAVTLPGYGEGTRQLRPAQVVVAKGRTDGPAS
ncbi:nucleotide exchange factor GrpE [Actinoallomurus acaciae]|uniref:Nucleotide exchange factor GrpE n=1 Tax=Actinoallomurus acaciae TaxID=502577 RepID=A0ABV5Y8H7_9ACTN